jgi:MFS family permease
MYLLLWINSQFRLAAQRLLRLDQPMPVLSDDEIESEVERNYGWNFAVNLADGACFFFGLSFISSSTIVPLFISKLTSSPLPIGLASVIAQGGWYLPQLFTANVVERLPRRKPIVVHIGFFSERVPVWLFVPIALLIPRSAPLALALFLACYAWLQLGGGLIATAWQDMIARCFPVDRRGRFWGITTFAGTATGIFGAALSTRILGTFPFPVNFAYVFAAASVSITISWFFISLTREPVLPITAPRRSNRQFWVGVSDILCHDHNFRRFLVARLTLAMGKMGWGFVTVAAVQRWQVADGTVGVYTAALLLGQTLGNVAFGLLADRLGHKLSLEMSGLAACLAFAMAWLAPSPEWYYAVFVLLGVTLGAVIVSGILVSMEFCESQRRPTYVGITNTGVGLISVVAPLLGAWLVTISYGWLFALSAGVNLVALVLMRWWVQEPRWARTAAI